MCNYSVFALEFRAYSILNHAWKIKDVFESFKDSFKIKDLKHQWDYFSQKNGVSLRGLEPQKMYKQMEPILTLSDFTRVEKTMEDLQGQVQFLTIELEKVKQSREISIKYKK